MLPQDSCGLALHSAPHRAAVAATIEDADMNASERFGALMAQDAARISLDEAALLLAAEEYPGLDVASYLAQLDSSAERLQPQISGELEPVRLIRIINTFLFDTLRFRGNVREYYDPRNSYLNEVLDRQLGIPITLAIV